MTQLSASVETIYKLRDDLHAVEALLGDLDNLCDAVAVHRTKLHAKRKVAEYQRHANTSLQTQMEDFRYKVRLEKAERNKPLAVRLKESMLSFAENVQQQRARAETPTVETAPGAAAGFAAAAAAGSAVVAGGDGGGAAVEVPADGGAAVDGPADGGESAADGGESAADGAAGGEPETTPISEEANATGNAAELSAGDEEAVVAAGEEDETDEEEDDGKDDEEKETAKEDTAQEEAAPAESNADAGGKGGAKKKKGKKKK